MKNGEFYLSWITIEKICHRVVTKYLYYVTELNIVITRLFFQQISLEYIDFYDYKMLASGGSGKDSLISSPRPNEGSKSLINRLLSKSPKLNWSSQEHLGKNNWPSASSITSTAHDTNPVTANNIQKKSPFNLQQDQQKKNSNKTLNTSSINSLEKKREIITATEEPIVKSTQKKHANIFLDSNPESSRKRLKSTGNPIRSNSLTLLTRREILHDSSRSKFRDNPLSTSSLNPNPSIVAQKRFNTFNGIDQDKITTAGRSRSTGSDPYVDMASKLRAQPKKLHYSHLLRVKSTVNMPQKSNISPVKAMRKVSNRFSPSAIKNTGYINSIQKAPNKTHFDTNSLNLECTDTQKIPYTKTIDSSFNKTHTLGCKNLLPSTDNIFSLTNKISNDSMNKKLPASASNSNELSTRVRLCQSLFKESSFKIDSTVHSSNVSMEETLKSQSPSKNSSYKTTCANVSLSGQSNKIASTNASLFSPELIKSDSINSPSMRSKDGNSSSFSLTKTFISNQNSATAISCPQESLKHQLSGNGTSNNDTRYVSNPLVSEALHKHADFFQQKLLWLFDRYRLHEGKIMDAVKSTSFDFDLADWVLSELSKGNEYPSDPHIWSPYEDKLLKFSQNPEDIEKLKSKHGNSLCRKRLRFLKNFELYRIPS